MFFGLRNEAVRAAIANLLFKKSKEFVWNNSGEKRCEENRRGVFLVEKFEHPTQHSDYENADCDIAVSLWFEIPAGIAPRDELQPKKIGAEKTKGQRRMFRGERSLHHGFTHSANRFECGQPAHSHDKRAAQDRRPRSSRQPAAPLIFGAVRFANLRSVLHVDLGSSFQ